MSAATYGTAGGFDPMQPGNPSGAASTGIGIGAIQSGPTGLRNFTVDAANDVVLQFIGSGSNAPPNSSQNLGNVVSEPTTFVAGSGYTPDGRYRVQSAGGGQPNGAAEIELTVAGGAITWARVVRGGFGFTSAPTFTVANAINFDTGVAISGGTGGTVTVTVANNGSKPISIGTPGTNKPMRRVVAVGAVAIGAAVTPGTYLNQSGRALVAGDELFAVAP